METLENITRIVEHKVKVTGTQYSDWFIGMRGVYLIPTLAKNNSIELTLAIACTTPTAQKVVAHFVSKGMERDVRMSINAAQGIFIYRKSQ